ncbi:hypothetical protein [Dyadobacter psychrotolerans]|uniref:Uncharacterized protein n=1 Tax=Dyadobacter psychrotolerans TaxID=2541721 RepID=A0A4R5DVM9_9BACT|nr:hypothetical protein [Dyadobacter psychrotolerans]TDE18612.1 hypothetical protein E0F88_03475 [Dyadobacter psychrotolerans]
MKQKASIFHFLVDAGSFAFLLLPNIIFLVGWYRWYIGLPMAIVSGYLFYRFCIGYRNNMVLENQEVPDRRFLLTLLGISVFVAYISGMGEMTYQVTDYIKHNVIFSNLATKPWPVLIEDPKQPAAFLCYGIAYYLPASLIGKILGLKVVVVCSFLWGVSGIFLCLIWVNKTINLYKWQLVVLFLFFAGLDPLFNIIDGQRNNLNDILSWDGLGFPILLSYMSPVRLMVWNPQYVFPAWIGTALIVQLGRFHKNGVGISAFLSALTLLWAPFITMGLIPVWLYFLVKSRFKNLINYYALSGLVLVVLIGPYYAAHQPIQDYPYLLWQEGIFQAIHDYTFFIFMEIGIYLVLVYLVDRKFGFIAGELRSLMLLSVVVLLILPVYRMGIFNDFLMRVSMPSLFLMTIGVIVVMYEILRKKLYKKSVLTGALCIFFLIGAMSPLRYMFTPVFPPGRYTLNSINDEQYSVFGMNELYDGWEISFQYTGSEKSFYYRYLSNK